MFKNQKKINEDIFLKNIYDKKTKTIESKYIDGLFSRSRDSLHQREIQIVDQMLMNKLIDVDSCYLCDNTYYKDYKKYKHDNYRLFINRGRYKYDCTMDMQRELGLKNLYIFRAYRQEDVSCLLSKYIAFEYFKKFYDIKWNRDDESFYVKELNLLIVYENQKIIDFIYRCLDKDINLAIISDYTDNEENKLAIRYIKPKHEIMETIYPEGSLYYN